MTLRIRMLIALVFVAGALAACGEDDDESPVRSGPESAVTTTVESEPHDAGRESGGGEGGDRAGSDRDRAGAEQSERPAERADPKPEGSRPTGHAVEPQGNATSSYGTTDAEQRGQDQPPQGPETTDAEQRGQDESPPGPETTD
jgi:hypothetical protein